VAELEDPLRPEAKSPRNIWAAHRLSFGVPVPSMASRRQGDLAGRAREKRFATVSRCPARQQ